VGARYNRKCDQYKSLITIKIVLFPIYGGVKYAVSGGDWTTKT
jgi:hypothetical protein